jgi:hypothetical protein
LPPSPESSPSKPGFFDPLVTGDEVKFRLTYDGPLKAAGQSSSRLSEKHRIRRAVHLQLRQLWNQTEILQNQLAWSFFRQHVVRDETIRKAEQFKRGKFSFFPIVREDLNLVCDLDILFLRRDIPGRLVQSGGDLDNRIKTLFDALRVPDEEQVRDYEPEKGLEDDPFFLCLAEDDKLITGFRVTTDRLLEPASGDRIYEHDVRLIIRVEIMATKLTEDNMGYFSHF